MQTSGFFEPYFWRKIHWNVWLTDSEGKEIPNCSHFLVKLFTIFYKNYLQSKFCCVIIQIHLLTNYLSFYRWSYRPQHTLPNSVKVYVKWGDVYVISFGYRKIDLWEKYHYLQLDGV